MGWDAPLNQVIGAGAYAHVERSSDSVLDIQRGLIGGMAIGDKFGYSSGLGVTISEGTPASWVDLWAYGGQRTSPSGTFTPFFASDDSADTDIDIEWTYLDTAGVEQTVTVATDASDGQTPVSLGVTATESYRGENAAATALVGNVALASANSFTAGAPDNQNEVLAYIPIGYGQTQQLTGRVPAGKARLLQKLSLPMARASGAAGSALIDFQTRLPGRTFVTKRPLSISNVGQEPEDMRAITLTALQDYRVRIKDVSDNATTINGTLLFFDVDV